MKKISFAKAIPEAIAEEMDRDPTVFILGEDMEQGGGWGQTTGLFAKYGRARVKNTPISETAILGAAIGAAATGMRPVPEIMFNNLAGVCMDELYNQLSKLVWMTAGQMKLPVTVRMITGGGYCAGPHHSSCLEGLFMSIPGLKIVVPSTA